MKTIYEEEFDARKDSLNRQELAKNMKPNVTDHFNGLFMMFMVKAHPEYVIDYCKVIGRFKDIEPFILTDVSLACTYAEEVIKGRWEADAEEKIAHSLQPVWHLHHYAKNIIKGRFPAYEKKLKGTSDLKEVIEYCKAIGKRWPEMEERIVKKAPFSSILEYVRIVVKGRFEAAEKKIMTKPKWIMEYCEIIGKPTKELHTAMTMFSFQEPDNKTIKKFFNTYGQVP